MNTNTTPIQRDEWYEQEREESTLIIQTFTSIIENNTNTREKNEKMIKTGGTYISVYTKIESVFKTYRFLILTPFDTKKVPRIENQNPQTEYDYDHPIYTYAKKDSNLFMKDFYFYADKSFYNWMYSELQDRMPLPVMISIGEDKMSWKLTRNDNLIINALNYDDNMDTYFNFEQWYNNSVFTMSFDLEILNPHLYSAPFLCKPYKYKYTPNGTNYFS